MQLDSLVGLRLIYTFLQAINAEFEWVEGDSSIHIVGGNEFFSKKSIFVSSYETLANFLNLAVLLDRYAIEISISYNQDENIKTFHCSRMTQSGTSFHSTNLLEAILRVVVEWRYGADVDSVEKLQNKVQADRSIPLDSLGLSFALLLALRKRKINNVADLSGYSMSDVLDVLHGNINLLAELQQKLSAIGVELG